MAVFSGPQATSHPTAKPRPVFRMEQGDDRMAGSVPVWGAPKTAQEETLAALSGAGPVQPHVDGALAYQADHSVDPTLQGEEPFGFGDLIDIINPLQHIPLVSTAYREITGDTIRPSSRVFGGALFGGAVGAAAGLVNVIVAEETGGTIDEHVMAALKDEAIPNPGPNPGPSPSPAHQSIDQTASQTSLAQLDRAATAPLTPPTPETLLAFNASQHYESAAALGDLAPAAGHAVKRQVWKFNE
ncbi:hypothetical protein [Micavibrio aeruginosavorus]|uniref:hypothetical protein n=1 Tax=Micavibrio aeruginosavorus TaxID=349221 RepID=UPI003F4A866D